MEIAIGIAETPTGPKIGIVAGNVRLVVDPDGATSLGVQLIELAALLRGQAPEAISSTDGESGLVVPRGLILPSGG